MSGTAQKTQNGGDLAVSHPLQNVLILPHDTSADPDSKLGGPDFYAAVNLFIRKAELREQVNPKTWSERTADR